MSRRTVTLLALTGALAAPATAAAGTALAASGPVRPQAAPNHSVVPFKSVAGVTLGSTPARVHAQLGAPSRMLRSHGKISTYYYNRIHLVVEFNFLVRNDPAESIGVNGGRYHTVHGLHIGSPLAAVRTVFGHRLKSAGPNIYSVTGDITDSGTSDTTFVMLHGRVSGMFVQHVTSSA